MQSYSTLKSKGTTATISGLKPATRYIFQVRARTSAGCGRFSQTVEVETGKPGECVEVALQRCAHMLEREGRTYRAERIWGDPEGPDSSPCWLAASLWLPQICARFCCL